MRGSRVKCAPTSRRRCTLDGRKPSPYSPLAASDVFLLEAVSKPGGRGSGRAENSTKRGSAGASPSRIVVLKCALVSVVRGAVELGLFRSGQAVDVFGTKRMVAREMRPECHAADARIGNFDRFEPDPDLIRLQTS